MDETVELNLRAGGQIRETVDLTVALEAGDITPEEYVRQHAIRIGEGNIFQFALIPLIASIWSSFRRVQGATVTKVSR